MTELEILQMRFDAVYEQLAKLHAEPKLAVVKGDVEILNKINWFLERGELPREDEMYEFKLLLCSLQPLLKEPK